MSVLKAAERNALPDKDFAGPHRSFPLTDKNHDRAALQDVPKAEHSGSITHAEGDRIKAEARAKLGEKGGDPPTDHKSAVAKMHPEHVHKLVEHAAKGHFGPEAQKMAQQAQQAPADNDGDADDQPQAPARNPFVGSQPQQAPAAPASRASVFGGGGF